MFDNDDWLEVAEPARIWIDAVRLFELMSLDEFTPEQAEELEYLLHGVAAHCVAKWGLTGDDFRYWAKRMATHAVSRIPRYDPIKSTNALAFMQRGIEWALESYYGPPVKITKHNIGLRTRLQANRERAAR